MRFLYDSSEPAEACDQLQFFSSCLVPGDCLKMNVDTSADGMDVIIRPAVVGDCVEIARLIKVIMPFFNIVSNKYQFECLNIRTIASMFDFYKLNEINKID